MSSHTQKMNVEHLSGMEKQGSIQSTLLMRRAISYVLTARRAFNVDELLQALSVESTDTEISEDRILDIQDLEPLISDDFLLPRPETALARISVAYLRFDDFKTGPCGDWNTTIQRLQKYPFLAYAVTHWGSHFKECQDDEETSKLVRYFLVDDAKVSSALQMMYLPRLALQQPQVYQSYPWHQRFPKEFSALHVVVHFGLDTILSMLLSRGLTEFVDAQDSHGRTALMSASANGHKLTVGLLLDQGASKTLEDEEGWTALDLSVLNGFANVAEILLNHSDLDILQKNKTLSLAAQVRSETMVRLLLDSGAEVNGKDQAGNIALMFAVPQGHHDVVRILVERGSEVDSKDVHDNALLHWAVNYPDILLLLLKKGANVHAKNHQGKTALHWASQEGQTESVQLLLKYGSEVNAEDTHGFTSLHLAALKGHQNTVKLLLENGANTNSQNNHGWTPLHAALLNHHFSLINLLTNNEELTTTLTTFFNSPLTRPIFLSLTSQKSPSIATLSSSPILHAINSTHHSLLLSTLANPPPPPHPTSQPPSTYTPLTLSSHLGLYPFTETLHLNSHSPNHPDTTLHYPIHYATLNADALIRANANVHAKDEYGKTVLHYAAEQESGETVLRYAVKERGADVNVKDLWGRTPLFYGVEAGLVGNITLLMELGADVGMTAGDGTTVLHLAAFGGDVTVMRKLLGDEDVDVDVVAQGGLTPLHVAVVRGHRDVAKVLLENGADREDECRFDDEAKNEDEDLLSSPLLGVGEVLVTRKVRQLVTKWDGNRDKKAFTVRELAVVGGVADVVDIPVPEPGVWNIGRLLNTLGLGR
ncbi:ankyrin repeat-containing domain protein [Podospora fimiseda]|uniref:Ankyrin repeat-containing domain protein n=1 Tax=Podospora fimiseda TaxID=252190 RepID=A0AAN7H442_9PEZI|nr:ankyrin repeat-containing domain protein [Podospora fimiseda]